MILHVATNGPLIPAFLEFINSEFSDRKHQFWLSDMPKKAASIKQAKNVYVAKRSFLGKLYAYMLLVLHMHKADKVILHGLFNPRVVLILACCPWLLGKCYWVLWGGDYLYRKVAKRDLKYYLKEPFRRFVMKRIGYLVTYIPESVEIVRNWFGNRGKWVECLCYTSNVFYTADREVEPVQRIGKKVLIGNSATPTNRHFEAFDIIEPYVTEEICIYTPLSYGDKYYADKVIYRGEQLFGDQFYPLTEFLPRNEYQELLKEMDFVFFNHNRHQAMGTIISILGLGKTLYMSSEIASWSFLRDKGIEVFDIKNFDGFKAKADSEHNYKIIKSYFSEKALKSQWSEIFDQ